MGKSTLFNRLVGERKAIVDDMSGVTRDRQYEDCEWNGRTFTLVDTGGYVENSEDIFEKEIRKQVQIALDEADIILFVCDVVTGITDLDEQFAQLLRKSNKPVLMIGNKSDNQARLLDSNELYALGFEELFPISSISGSGTGDLLDRIVELLPENRDKADDTLPKIAIVGQPNAGKSSLTNVLLGNERTIVSEIPGTTRDSIHTHYNLFNKEFIIIDTAGLRKKNREKEDVEFYSVIRAVKSIEQADVCLLVIDSTKGITAQDISIFSLASRKGKGIVILMNKWDLMEKDHKTTQKLTQDIHNKTAPLTDIPILFISTLEKQRIHKMLDVLMEVYENRQRRISTPELNDIMLEEIKRNPPPAYRGNAVKIKFITQIPTAVPSFTFYCNHPKEVKTPYRNFLENKLRSHFRFSGVPIRMFFRKK